MNLQDIPAGAIVSVWGLSLFGRLICWYQGWQTGIKNLPNHSALYIGGGDNFIIEANRYVEKTKLQRYFGKKQKVVVSFYKPMTVAQQQVIKSNAYSSLGKKYDIPGILAFLFKNVKESQTANYCSELVARCYWWAGIGLSAIPWADDPNSTPKITPGDIYLWAVNHPEEWEVWVIWDK